MCLEENGTAKKNPVLNSQHLSFFPYVLLTCDHLMLHRAAVDHTAAGHCKVG